MGNSWLPIIEEHVTFPSGGGSLAGVMAYPVNASPKAGILFCSPHPNFAGNMENNVIAALSRALAVSALTLRFDYRGVGASTIHLPEDESVYDFWNRVEETQNYTAPLEDVRSASEFLGGAAAELPLYAVGYSFGGIVGLIQLQNDPRMRAGIAIAPPLAQYPFEFLRANTKPCKMLCGSNDFVFSQSAWDSLRAETSGSVEFLTLNDHDHFFRGEEALLCRHTAAFLGLSISEEGVFA